MRKIRALVLKSDREPMDLLNEILDPESAYGGESQVIKVENGADVLRHAEPNSIIFLVSAQPVSTNSNGAMDTVVYGNLSLNQNRKEVSIGGQRVHLSLLEFELLTFFSKHQDQLLSRQTILQEVWKNTTVSKRTVDTHVVSLRRKLVGSEFSFRTIYGGGYLLERLRREN